jgi:cytochrome P450
MTNVATDAGGATVPSTAAVGSFDSMENAPTAPYYDELRALGDVVRDVDRGVWLVTTYEGVKELSRADQRLWQHPTVYDPQRPPFGISEAEWIEFVGGKWALQIHEGETHDRMHRWWMRVFSPKVLAQWGELLIDPIIHQAIDAIASKGRAEFGTEFCELITGRSMAAVMGLPHDDEDWLARFRERTAQRTALFQYQGNPDKAPDGHVDRCLQAGYDLGDMIRPFVDAKAPGVETAEDPTRLGTDFIALLWNGGEDLWGDEEFDAGDVVAHAKSAFTAAADSAGTTAGNGFYLLASQPEIQDRVREDPRAAANFVEETLRLYSQVEYRPRWAKQDLELAGVQIKRGEMAIALSACANRDPAHYANPLAVDLDRPTPRDHYGFFQGPRLCVGQGLARFMLQRIYTVTLSRLEDLVFAPGAPEPRFTGGMLRKWEPLHLQFQARG